jgi:DNA-directed RNA polymerase subunit RPC12/RpoP
MIYNCLFCNIPIESDENGIIDCIECGHAFFYEKYTEYNSPFVWYVSEVKEKHKTIPNYYCNYGNWTMKVFPEKDGKIYGKCKWFLSLEIFHNEKEIKEKGINIIDLFRNSKEEITTYVEGQRFNYVGLSGIKDSFIEAQKAAENMLRKYIQTVVERTGFKS